MHVQKLQLGFPKGPILGWEATPVVYDISGVTHRAAFGASRGRHYFLSTKPKPSPQIQINNIFRYTDKFRFR